MKKIIVILFVLLLAAMLLVYLLFTGDAEEPSADTAEPAAEAAPPLFQDQPHQGLATVHCALEVNGARFRTLGRGVPLYVKVIVSNPLEDRVLELYDCERLRPDFRNLDGTDSGIGLELITPAPERVPPIGVAVLTWVPAADLPPGEYDIDLAPPDGMWRDTAGIDRVRVKPALLRLTGEPAGPAEIAYYNRQIMAARGQDDEILQQLRLELEATPENLALRRELVDTLERTGNFTTSREELIELGLLAQQRQQGDDEAAIHLPAWIITRDRMLQEKIRHLPQ